MKKLVLVLAVACSAAGAMTRMGTTPDGTWYHLEHSLRDGVLRAWMLLDRTAPDTDGARSTKVLYEIDCRDQTVRTTAHSYAQALGRGAVLVSDTQREWVPVVPGSNPHALHRAFCR